MDLYFQWSFTRYKQSFRERGYGENETLYLRYAKRRFATRYNA